MENAEALLHAADSRTPHALSRTGTYPTTFEWFLCLTGGLALFLPFILLIGETELQQEEMVLWYYWLSVIIGSPHVYATYVRQSRKIKEGKSIFWLGIPTYIGIAIY